MRLSVHTSAGFENSVAAVRSADLASAVVRRNPQLKWADTSHRGVTVELTPTSATSEWLLLDTVRQRSTALAGAHQMSVVHGTNTLS
jgi:alkaline phosphatase D